MTTEELLSLRKNSPTIDAEGNEYETFRKSILRAAVTKIMRNCDSQGGFVKISPPPTTTAPEHQSTKASSANCKLANAQFFTTIARFATADLFCLQDASLLFKCFVLSVACICNPCPFVFVSPSACVVFVTLALLYLRPSSAGASYCFP